MLLGIKFMVYYHDFQTVALTWGFCGKPLGWGWRVGGRGAGEASNPSSPLQLNQPHLNLHLILSEKKKKKKKAP